MGDRDGIRKKIDEIDETLLSALNERMELARKIGEIKRIEGSPVFDPKREKEVLSRLEGLNVGPLNKDALRTIFGEIISASRSMQGSVSVACLGPEGTFSHLAALKKFGKSGSVSPLRTIQDVFAEVEKGNCSYGIVPIENSTGGAVNDSLDLLASTSLKVCGEVYLKISHDLASLSGVRGDVRRIFSHPQAFSQCRKWLSSNFLDVPVVETVSTAEAARKASREPDVAAIVSSSAASLYGLSVVESRIEDHAGNSTHFFVIGRDLPAPTGSDKTSILLALDDVPGSLYKTLKPLHDAGVNMTRIVSIPAGHRGWRYIFFIDLQGHGDDPKVSGVIAEIKRITAWCNVLGSYPRTEE